MSKPQRNSAIKHVRDRRSDLEEKIKHLPNVRGSMIGLRLRAGKATDEVCLSILVGTKKHPDDLPKSARIPRSIKIAGKVIPIDVVEMRRMRPQAGLFPEPGPIGINVSSSIGTIGAFCNSINGVFAMTCAHVFGPGGSSSSGALTVEAWSSVTRNWVSIGRTLFSVSGPGSGSHGDFGFADAGLMTLEHPELVARAKMAKPISALSCDLGTVVHADGSVRGARSGQVVGIEKALQDFWADVVIQVLDPGTFSGDSGMLWKNQNGDAVAIHAFGENVGDGAGSHLTAAMFAERAALKLGVRLLSVPD